ncbi:hypothetical protein Ae201684P_014293 [Aphanomyces euteiches]|uniref:Uncharacterized protein n=1 Tax=Aphanomyces euteiches TaxID=100861 RepID=A0A6G0WRL0_9STRA|nr:hypothetical protein Ae201684_012396 [Aphanomyces euteiches]KAH9090492.1 hypothetical protein Ae201684P_014293 [Aphanomyces euteiches]
MEPSSDKAELVGLVHWLKRRRRTFSSEGRVSMGSRVYSRGTIDLDPAGDQHRNAWISTSPPTDQVIFRRMNLLDLLLDAQLVGVTALLLAAVGRTRRQARVAHAANLLFAVRLLGQSRKGGFNSHGLSYIHSVLSAPSILVSIIIVTCWSVDFPLRETNHRTLHQHPLKSSLQSMNGLSL